MSGDGLDLFLSHLASFLVEMERENRRGISNCTENFCEYAVRQAGVYATHVYRIFVTAEETASRSVSQSENHVRELVGALLSHIREIKGE